MCASHGRAVCPLIQLLTNLSGIRIPSQAHARIFCSTTKSAIQCVLGHVAVGAAELCCCLVRYVSVSVSAAVNDLTALSIG